MLDNTVSETSNNGLGIYYASGHVLSTSQILTRRNHMVASEPATVSISWRGKSSHKKANDHVQRRSRAAQALREPSSRAAPSCAAAEEGAGASLSSCTNQIPLPAVLGYHCDRARLHLCLVKLEGSSGLGVALGKLLSVCSYSHLHSIQTCRTRVSGGTSPDVPQYSHTQLLKT